MIYDGWKEYCILPVPVLWEEQTVFRHQIKVKGMVYP